MNISFNSAAEVSATSVSSTSRHSQVSDGPGEPRESASASRPGQFLAKLEALKESDPAAFKQTLEDASKKLADKAATESDPEKAKHLQEMSAKFAEAAKTGDLSALKPPDHKGPPPPPPPATGSSGGGAAQTFDPADANVDGKVTQQEQEAYDARKQVAKAVQTYQQATTQAASSAQEAVLATLAS